MNLLYCTSFILHTNYGQSSCLHNLKNGVAQGSVLAPTSCNVYTYDFPETLSTKYIYADDVALTFSAPTFSQSEKKSKRHDHRTRIPTQVALKALHQQNCLLSFPHLKSSCRLSTQSRILSWKAPTIPE